MITLNEDSTDLEILASTEEDLVRLYADAQESVKDIARKLANGSD